MKYFDIIPGLLQNELLKRGVEYEKLLYCVKSDMTGDGCYYDVYITFDNENLYIIEGYENYTKETKKKPKQLLEFKCENYDEIAVSQITRMYVDRYQNTARLMIVRDIDGVVKEYPIARFSIGFSEKFERFSQRLNNTHNGEPCDDTLLEGIKTHCPNCGERFPDGHIQSVCHKGTCPGTCTRKWYCNK